MDGYALRARRSCRRQPTRGSRSPAPASPAQAYEGGVAAGHCVRIMTGAVMPPGLDTVVPQEFTRVDGDAVIIPPGVVRGGDNRRLAGEDLARGEAALTRGRRVSPADLGLLASLGQARSAGVPQAARRVLLHRRRAAFDRRAAARRLRLRQQPLHPLGHAAAARRRGASTSASCATNRPRSKPRFTQRGARCRRGHHLRRRQRRRGRPHEEDHGRARRGAVLAHRDAAGAADGHRPRRRPLRRRKVGPAPSCSGCPATRWR